MKSYDFYKSKYDRELNRRNFLDTSAINTPIAGNTIVVGILSYILSQHNFIIWNLFSITVLSLVILTTVTTLISLFYIFLSYNNLLKGHKYLNFGLLEDFRKVENYFLAVNESENKFEQDIIDKIIKYSDNHTVINDKRGNDLFISRKFIIIGVIICVLNLIILTINNKFLIC